jgi:hypothetical protein
LRVVGPRDDGGGKVSCAPKQLMHPCTQL